MEGDRHMVSAVFLVFMGLCSYGINAHGNHHQIRVIQSTIPKHNVAPPPPPTPPQTSGGGGGDQNKCVAIIRRTFLERESVVYPCFRPMRGVTPVAAHQSPMGLICRGMTTVPHTKYARVPICCPGYEPDSEGGCVQRSDEATNMLGIPSMDRSPAMMEDRSRRLEDLEKYPSTYEKRPAPRWSPGEMMMQRLKAIMERRMQLIKELEQKMPDQEAVPTQPAPQSPIARIFPQVRKMIMITRTLRPIFPSLQPNRDDNDVKVPQIPAVPNPPTENPLRHHLPERRKNIVITHRQENFMHGFPHNFSPNGGRGIIVTTQEKKVINIPTRNMNQDFLTNMNADFQQNMNPDFPQIPRATPAPVTRKDNPFFVHPDFAHQQLSNRQQIQRQMIPDMHFRQMQQPVFRRQFPGVHLPQYPIEMPPVIVQPGPNLMAPPPCFSAYLNVVKMCFSGANIQMPTDPGMFNGEYNYDGVCQKKDEIINCIVRNIRPCNMFEEQILVKTTLTNTFAEIDRICQFDQIPNIEERLNADDEKKLPPVSQILAHHQHHHDNMNMHDHAHSHGHGHVHSHPHSHDHGHSHDHDHFHAHVQDKVILPIESKPVEITPEPTQPTPPTPTPTLPTLPQLKDKEVKLDKKVIDEIKQEIKKVEDIKAKADDLDPSSAEPQVKQVDGEVIVHEYYLPLLIGTAIGVVAIIILLLALICVCCRRRVTRKLYLEKEPEKPKLLDGIYTIGLPPPIYEVNGIPPLSYEEAKGEKITGSPSSVRRHNNENADAEESTSRKGVVSDI